MTGSYGRGNVKRHDEDDKSKPADPKKWEDPNKNSSDDKDKKR